jgi:hypothetical protein
MVAPGDKGIVMNTFGDKVFVPLGDVEVGDTVAVYNLVDDTRIAVPMLTLGVGDMVFATPSFDFAGFDWKLDFDFNLIYLDPLIFGSDVILAWDDIDSNAGRKNYKGCGQLWLYGGQYARADLSPWDYKYCAIRFCGDSNDGVARIYVDDELVESLCTYNYGRNWWVYESTGSGMSKLEVINPNINCGGSSNDVAISHFAFYNNPDFELEV